MRNPLPPAQHNLKRMGKCLAAIWLVFSNALEGAHLGLWLLLLFLLLPRLQLFKPMNPAAPQREKNPPNDAGKGHRTQ